MKPTLRQYPDDPSVARGFARPTLLPLMLLLLVACSWSSLARYDPITYQRLTDLKPLALRVQDSFGNPEPNTAGIEEVSLRLARLYEYEKGKGEGNEIMVEQVKLLGQIFDRGVERRQQSGPWNTTQLENRRKILAEAFDVAIATEREKN